MALWIAQKCKIQKSNLNGNKVLVLWINISFSGTAHQSCRLSSSPELICQSRHQSCSSQPASSKQNEGEDDACYHICPLSPYCPFNIGRSASCSPVQLACSQYLCSKAISVEGPKSTIASCAYNVSFFFSIFNTSSGEEVGGFSIFTAFLSL